MEVKQKGTRSPVNAILAHLQSKSTHRKGPGATWRESHKEGSDLPPDKRENFHRTMNSLWGNQHLNPKPCFFLLLSVLPHLVASWGPGGEARRGLLRGSLQTPVSRFLPQPLIQMFSLPPLFTFGPLVSVPWADFHHPIRNNTLFLLPAFLGTVGSKPQASLTARGASRASKEHGGDTSSRLGFFSVWTASIAHCRSVTQWFIKHTNNEWICSISKATCWSQTSSAELGEREQQNAYISGGPRPHLMACYSRKSRVPALLGLLCFSFHLVAGLQEYTVEYNALLYNQLENSKSLVIIASLGLWN